MWYATACFQKPNDMTEKPQTVVVNESKTIEPKPPQSGSILEGVFKDKTYPFQGKIPED